MKPILWIGLMLLLPASSFSEEREWKLYVGAAARPDIIGCTVQVLLMNRTGYDFDTIAVQAEIFTGNIASIHPLYWQIIDHEEDRTAEAYLNRPCRRDMRMVFRRVDICEGTHKSFLNCAGMFKDGAITTNYGGLILPVEFRIPAMRD